MEQAEIGHLNGRQEQIKKSIPAGVKCRILPNATAYHIKMDKGEYIIFQHLQIGPYSCWYTQYLLRQHRQMYCKMHSDDVEFHCMLSGEAMYILPPDTEWIKTYAGTYNVIVNPPYYTTTSFIKLPMSTFDIHIKPAHFKQLVKLYPIFENLNKELLLGKTSILFPQKQESDLNFKVKINNLLRQLESLSNINNYDEACYQNQIDDIIASYAKSADQLEMIDNLKPDMVEKITNVKEFIAKEYLDNKVVTRAQKLFSISPTLLNKNFKILYKMTPREFLLKKKIEAVKRFLRKYPKATLTEISMAAGFSDNKHTNERFKQLEGISIKQYRQKLLDDVQNKIEPSQNI